MIQYHKYSLNEIESLLPWERQIYVALLTEHIKEENERYKNSQHR